MKIFSENYYSLKVFHIFFVDNLPMILIYLINKYFLIQKNFNIDKKGRCIRIKYDNAFIDGTKLLDDYVYLRAI